MRAFEELVERHQRAVIGTVAKMLGNASEAEDIAQQVFVRVWKSAGRYEAQAKFTTWLFTITRNLVFNEVRRRQRKPTVSADEREETTHRVLEDARAGAPEDEMLQAELEEAIDRAIRSLPEKQRMAVVLRRYEELPYEEIALLETSSGPLTYGEQNKTDSVLRKLREEAASLGANGILFQGTADGHGGGGVSVGAGGGRFGGSRYTSGGVGVNVSPRQKHGRGVAIYLPNPPPEQQVPPPPMLPATGE